MKKWIKIIAAFLSIIGIFVLVFFVNRSHDNTFLSIPKIIIKVDGENAFLTKKEIYNRLLLKKLVFKQQKKGEGRDLRRDFRPRGRRVDRSLGYLLAADSPGAAARAA